MKFEHDARNLTLILRLDEDGVIQKVTLLTAVAKAEALGYWEARVVIPAQYRYSELLYDWTEVGETAGMVTFSRAIGLRQRVTETRPIWRK